ncbi:alpha/beta hydrolase [Salinisphaera sp. SPP-AMP-43]|uniref:alpha/beta fold hydrolase n=1 Tax=Salinisphaera sp. SPP-AMP-43 TaxID=3121288 RepID=UPI003C6DF71E
MSRMRSFNAGGQRFLDSLSTIDIGGLNYAYRRVGSPGGQPLLLLHGLMDTSASFARLVDALAVDGDPGFDVIAPDWRGHGQSQATPGEYWFPNYLADLDALLDALDIARPAVLIGHSMGGQIASLFAGVRPERSAALIALDSLNIPDSDPGEAPTRYRSWMNARHHSTARQPTVYNDPDQLIARLARRYPELDQSERSELAAHWLVPGPEGWRLHVDPSHQGRMPYGFRAAEAKAIWQNVACPVFCLDGGRSPVARLISAEEMAERRACFADMTQHSLPGCGHMLHIQAPRDVAAHINDFLARIETPG